MSEATNINIHITADAESFRAISAATAHALGASPKREEVAVREVDGGVVLDVPEKTRKLLVEFGWMPPVDGA